MEIYKKVPPHSIFHAASIGKGIFSPHKIYTNRIIQYVFSLCLILNSYASQAYIVRCVKYFHETHNVWLIGLGIVHTGAQDASSNHRKTVWKKLQEARTLYPHVIAEDMKSYAGPDQELQKIWNLHKITDAQEGIVKICQRMGIPATNIEYRFAKAASLGPLLSNEHISANKLFQADSIPASQLAHEFLGAMGEISTWQDPSLVSYYTHCCKDSLQTPRPLIELLHQYNGSMHQFVYDYIPEEKRLAWLYTLYTLWGAELINARALHYIAHAQDTTLVLLTGNAHLFSIDTTLQKALSFRRIIDIGYHEPMSSPILTYEQTTSWAKALCEPTQFLDQDKALMRIEETNTEIPCISNDTLTSFLDREFLAL